MKRLRRDVSFVAREQASRFPSSMMARRASLRWARRAILVPSVPSWAHGLRGLLGGGIQSGQHPHHKGQQLVHRLGMGRLARHHMLDVADELLKPLLVKEPCRTEVFVSTAACFLIVALV